MSSNPYRVLTETFLLGVIVYLLVYKTSQPKGKPKLSLAERKQLVDDWKPIPLAPRLDEISSTAERALLGFDNRVVVSVNPPYMTLTSRTGGKKGERKVLNFSTLDHLSLSTTPEIQTSAKLAMEKYGFGSCGPRGFYGTIDSHLFLENKVAKMFGTPSSIMYSDGASTVSSTISAFAKRGDLIVVDSGVNESVMTGVTLSRGNCKVFKHNDMEDLREVLEKIRKDDRKLGRKFHEQRRFIVVEGLYRNYGHICPLPQIMALKNEFKFRLIMDDSYSFGTLGPRGLGILDHWGMLKSDADKRQMVNDDSESSNYKGEQEVLGGVEIMCVSMENSVGSVGGVTLGSSEVVDHQRLSGSGYCFSASTPPFLANCAVTSLEIIEKDGPKLLNKLGANVKLLVKGLKGIKGLKVLSDDQSALVFVGFEDGIAVSQEDEADKMSSIQTECDAHGVSLVYTGDHVKGPLLLVQPDSCLRLSVSVSHDAETIAECLKVIKRVCEEIL